MANETASLLEMDEGVPRSKNMPVIRKADRICQCISHRRKKQRQIPLDCKFEQVGIHKPLEALGQSICFGITCNFSHTLTHVITVSSPQGTCLLLFLRNNPECQASQASRELPLPPEQNNCLEKGAWGMYPAPTLVMQGLPAVIRCQKRRAGTPKQLKSKVGHTFFFIVTDGICAQLL